MALSILTRCALAAAAPVKDVSNTATDKLINEKSFWLIVKAAIIEIREKKKGKEGAMIESSVFQARNIKKQGTVRRQPALLFIYFFYLSRTIFSMMPNCFLPLLRYSQLPLHRASTAAGKLFPGETAAAEVQNGLTRRLQSNI